MLDLSKHRLVRETPEAWHVHDGEREFAVAKHGLDPETHQQIAQHFSGASGKPEDSVVKPDAADSGTGTLTPDQIHAASNKIIKDFDERDASGEFPHPNYTPKEGDPVGNFDPTAPYVPQPGDSATKPPPPAPGSFEEAAAASADYKPPAPEPDNSFDPGPQQGLGTNDPGYVPPAPPQPPQASPNAASGEPAKPLPSPELADPNQAAYDKETGIQSKAIEDLGKIQAEDAAARAKIYQAKAAADAKALDDSKALILGAMNDGKALQDAVLAKQIDPNGFWNSRSVPQKISAAIGMILGGLGSGLTGGPNYAAQVIGNAIDRDVAAQRANQDNLNAGIQHYIQKGHDVIAASQLWSANLKDMYAGQLEQQAAATQSKEAALASTLSASHLRQEALGQRYEVSTKFYRNKLDANTVGADVALAPLRLQNAKSAELGTQRVYGAQGNDPTAPPTALDLKKNIPGVQLVNGPHGEPQAALGEDSAKAVKESQTALAPIADALGQMRQLLGPEGSPVIGDRARAEALQNELALAINAATTNRAITSEEKDFITSRIPDLTDVVKPYAKQQLDELDRWMASKGAAVNKANLYGGQ